MPAPCSVVPLGTRSAARVAEAISGRWRREGHAQRQARTLAHQEQAIKSVLLGGKRRIQPPVAPLAPAPTLLCAASPGVFGPAAAFETPEHVGRGRKRRLRGLASWQSGNRRIGNVEFCSSTGSAASTGGSRHTGVRCDVVQRKGGGGRGSEGVWAASRRATGRMMLYLLDTTAEDCTVLCSAVQDGTVPDWNEALALAGGGWVLGTAQDGDGSQFSWKSAGRPRAGT